MKTFAKIVYVLLIVTALSYFLPWLYDLLLPDGVSDPYVEYSPVAGAMVVSTQGDDGKLQIGILGDDGKVEGSFTKNQRDSLLPQVYYTQLMARKQLPDTLLGKEMSVQNIRPHFYATRSSSREINKRQAPVYMIMESMPERITLEEPKQVFMFNDDDASLTFINMADNKVDADRSRRFTETFRKRGFSFPMTDWAANVTAQKNRDEGYLLIDNAGEIYHVKMQVGRPWMHHLQRPEGLDPEKVYILEENDESDLGFVVAKDGRLWFIEADHSIVPTPVTGIDPRRDNFTLMSNLFNKTVKINSPDSTRWVAIDTDTYELLGEYKVDREVTALEKAASWIFPWQLTFTSYSDSYVYPRLTDFSWRGMLVWAVILLCFFGFRKRK